MAKNILFLIVALSFSLLTIAQVSKGALKAYDRAIDAYIAKDYEQVVVEFQGRQLGQAPALGRDLA